MNKIKNLLLVLSGVVLTIGISSAYKLNASEVTYDNKNTTLESSTVSGAVNELGVLATTSMSELKSKLDSIETKIDNISSGESGNTDVSTMSQKIDSIKTVMDSINFSEAFITKNFGQKFSGSTSTHSDSSSTSVTAKKDGFCVAQWGVSFGGQSSVSLKVNNQAVTPQNIISVKNGDTVSLSVTASCSQFSGIYYHTATSVSLVCF